MEFPVVNILHVYRMHINLMHAMCVFSAALNLLTLTCARLAVRIPWWVWDHFHTWSSWLPPRHWRHHEEVAASYQKQPQGLYPLCAPLPLLEV